MAIPSSPTLSELVTEALKKAGEASPLAALVTRAQNQWMSEIKNDIWNRVKKLKLLQVTSHGIAPKGQSRFSYPDDYSSDLELTILDGTNTGTAQGGSINTITLAASSTFQESDVQGRDILITAGTGTASLGQITSYNASTKVATVTPNFKAAPASGSTYMIVDIEYPVEQKHIGQAHIYKQIGMSRPCYYFPIGDEDFGEFIFNSPPDKVYGIRLRYYANIMKVDTESTHMSTIYESWRNLFIEGIKLKVFEENDDDRTNTQIARYQSELNTLMIREKYGMDLSSLRGVVRDYG